MKRIDQEKEKLRKKKVLVVGAGRSGICAANLLRMIGCRATLSEHSPDSHKGRLLKRMESKGVRVEIGPHKESIFCEHDLIVLSPGVDPSIFALQKARSENIPIISEVELGFRLIQQPVIAITGTNGKTTTSTLLDEIFRQARIKSFLGGNIGTPLVQAAMNDQDYAYIIAEISSFQLEAITSFAPHIAAVLNFSPDHLDRYECFSEYIQTKGNIVKYQTMDDYLILNADDVQVASLAFKSRSKVYYFSQRKRVFPGIFIFRDWIHLCPYNAMEHRIIDVKELSLKGRHNLDNVMAASLAAYLADVPLEAIKEAVRKFKPLEHRMEPVAKINGALFINDSKGTNVGAMIKAVESFSEKIVLIGGGRDKGGDFAPLADYIPGRVKACVLIGEAKEKIAAVASSYTKVVLADDLEGAVKVALTEASEGDIVLFSPGCASFDMFKNFEERGREFKRIVYQLGNINAEIPIINNQNNIFV
ncbi:MAG: UDP-N-acetylmuramoyl-L-alanine--D-glutamate ligase [bacterium]